jgi:hypothetical protein
MDDLLADLQTIDPLWSVALVAAALCLLLIMRFWRTSFVRVLALAALVVFIGGAAAVGYYGYSYFEDMRRLDERRTLEERAAVLLKKAVEPDSVFACIDGSPVPAMQEACEQNLFAEPERVAAAVAIVTQRLALLADAVPFAKERDPGYFDNIAPLRKAMAADPYGLVGFVLSVEHGCSADACTRFALFDDTSRVKENMRGRRLEAHLAKYSAAWRGASVQPAEAAPASAASTSAPLVTISGEADGREVEKKDAAAAAPASPADVTPSGAAAALEIPTAATAPVLAPPAAAEGFGQPKAEPAAPPVPLPRTDAGKGKAKERPKAAAASARASEPVSGLPRVVPGDYVREREEAQTEAAARPGAPTPIGPPQQNFAR